MKKAALFLLLVCSYFYVKSQCGGPVPGFYPTAITPTTIHVVVDRPQRKKEFWKDKNKAEYEPNFLIRIYPYLFEADSGLVKPSDSSEKTIFFSFADNSPQSAYDIVNLLPGTGYHLEICTNCGNNQYAGHLKGFAITPKSSPCKLVLKKTENGNAQISIETLPQTIINARKVIMQYREAAGEWIEVIEQSSRSFAIYKLKYGLLYAVRVKFEYPNGVTTAWSEELVFTAL
jgi:hypothetical protein